MSKPFHPKCGKRFPAGTQAGHCATCCETFIGQASFDAHRVGAHGTAERRCELQPYESRGQSGNTVYGHWQDANGYWKLGRQLSSEEFANLWS